MAMFGAKEEQDYENGQMNGLLEQGCEFEGKLTFEGCVRVNGKFKGEVFSDGTLMIGESAHVEGQLEVGNVIIHGKVQGDVTAKEKIEMRRPAEVRGNIEARTLVIEEGVIFEGSCRMGGSAPVSLPKKTTEARELFSDSDEEDLEPEGRSDPDYAETGRLY